MGACLMGQAMVAGPEHHWAGPHWMGQVGQCSGASIQAPGCGGPATPRATELYCFESGF
jgi:hypothetical protein